jgi:hypothetical protein
VQGTAGRRDLRRMGERERRCPQGKAAVGGGRRGREQPGDAGRLAAPRAPGVDHRSAPPCSILQVPAAGLCPVLQVLARR